MVVFVSDCDKLVAIVDEVTCVWTVILTAADEINAETIEFIVATVGIRTVSTGSTD